jgi:hypothetical protein
MASACLLAIVAGPALGQDVARLRERLNGCWGNEPIQVAVRVEQRGGVKAVSSPTAPAAPETAANFEIGAANNMLTVRLAEDQVRQEDPALRKAKAPNAAADGLADVSLSRVAAFVNYGPALARALDGFRLEGRKPDACQGVPCTKWSLSQTENASAMGMSMKQSATWEIWMDAEGYPVAAERTEQTKTKALFVSTTSTSRTWCRFQRHGHRLVLVFEQTKGNHEVAGSQVSVTTTTTVGLKKDPPPP